MLGDIIILILESLGFRIGEKVRVKKGRLKILLILVIVLAIGLVITNFK